MNSPPPNLYANQYASNNLNQYQQQNVGGYQGYDMQSNYNAGQGYNHTGVPMPYDPSANQYHGYSAQGGPAMHSQSTYNMGAPTHGYNQQQQGPAGDQSFAIPGLNAPGISPLNMLSAGSSFLSGSQNWGSQYYQRMQQRIGWLSGGALNYHFAITNQYVRSKLLILLMPFLKSWSFSRQPEQIQGGHKYRPPRLDVNAPDLYIPMVSAWLYVILHCINALLLGKYRPDIMYSKVWWTGAAWASHVGVAWLLVRMMGLPTGLPWGELLSYTGYVFVPACWTLLLGMTAGNWAWWGGWLYGSICSAVFLVRTMKRVLFQEAKSYGTNLTLTNYLLLALAALQFPLLLWLCHVQLPRGYLSLHGMFSHPVAASTGVNVSPVAAVVNAAVKAPVLTG